MALVLRRNCNQQTGSYLGFGGASVISAAPGGVPACGGKTIDGAPITGCGNLYVDWRRNPKKYFEVRDGAWTGIVSVGEPETVEAPAKTPDAQPSSH